MTYAANKTIKNKFFYGESFFDFSGSLCQHKIKHEGEFFLDSNRNYEK